MGGGTSALKDSAPSYPQPIYYGSIVDIGRKDRNMRITVFNASYLNPPNTTGQCTGGALGACIREAAFQPPPVPIPYDTRPSLILISAEGKSGIVRYNDLVFVKLNYGGEYYLKFDPGLKNDNIIVYYFENGLQSGSNTGAYFFRLRPQDLNNANTGIVMGGSPIVLEASSDVSFSGSTNLCKPGILVSCDGGYGVDPSECIPECANYSTDKTNCMYCWNCDKSDQQTSDGCYGDAFYVSIAPNPFVAPLSSEGQNCYPFPDEIPYAGSLANSVLTIQLIDNNLPTPTAIFGNPSWPEWFQSVPVPVTNPNAKFNQWLDFDQRPNASWIVDGSLKYGAPGTKQLQFAGYKTCNGQGPSNTGNTMSITNVNGSYGDNFIRDADSGMGHTHTLNNDFRLSAFCEDPNNGSGDTDTFQLHLGNGTIVGTGRGQYSQGGDSSPQNYLLCSTQSTSPTDTPRLYPEDDVAAHSSDSRCKWLDVNAAFQCCTAQGTQDVSICGPNFLPGDETGNCPTLLTSYCASKWSDPDCQTFLQRYANNPTVKDVVQQTILNVLTDSNRGVPDYVSPSINSNFADRDDSTDPFFTTTFHDLCFATAEGGVCDDILNCFCAQFTTEDMLKDGTLQKLCGCHLQSGSASPPACPVGLAGKMRGLPSHQNQYTLPASKACHPICRYKYTVLGSDTTGGGACTSSECIIDDFTVNQINSIGNVDVSVVCGDCGSGGGGGCLCYMKDDVVNEFNSNADIKFSQNCNKCYLLSTGAEIPCNGGGGGGSGSSSIFGGLWNWIEENKLLVLGGSGLLFLILIGVIILIFTS